MTYPKIYIFVNYLFLNFLWIEPWGPFHKSSYERCLVYEFVEPVLNYGSNEFVALTNLCETGPWLVTQRFLRATNLLHLYFNTGSTNL